MCHCEQFKGILGRVGRFKRRREGGRKEGLEGGNKKAKKGKKRLQIKEK